MILLSPTPNKELMSICVVGDYDVSQVPEEAPGENFDKDKIA